MATTNGCGSGDGGEEGNDGAVVVVMALSSDRLRLLLLLLLVLSHLKSCLVDADRNDRRNGVDC